MDTNNVEQNLLFALLSLKLGFVDNQAMVDALNEWALRRERPIDDILAARAAICGSRLPAVQETFAQLLGTGGGDPHLALIALGLPAGLVETNLERLTDPEIRAELRRLDDAAATVHDQETVDLLRTEFDPQLAGDAISSATVWGNGPSPESRSPGTAVTQAAADTTFAASGGHEAFGPETIAHAAGPTTVLGPNLLEDTVPAAFALQESAASPATAETEDMGGTGAPKVDLPATEPIDSEPASTVDLGVDTGALRGAREHRAREGSASPSRYRSLRPHAKGGLGEVFVALDEELGREVALKEIQGRHAHRAESRARFLIEAEVTGGLEHPGIVPVYGLGQYPDGRPYYAMRFIRGSTLKEAIDAYHDPETSSRDPGERLLELRALLNRLIDVCNAMEYAHTRGILHRDIKPANIMLGAFGETLVVDWGLAKAVDRPEAASTQTGLSPLRPLSAGHSGTATVYGSTVGTPNFMSPEQASGALDRMGPPSDVYSLGATLYNILVGRPPFHEPQLGVLLHKVRLGQFPRPREISRAVHPALEAICLKAMALQPEDRYPSARALADDLEHWLADEPVTVYREPWTARLARWARRHKTLVATSAALGITAFIGLSIGTLLIQREKARTEANFVLARDAVDQMLTRLGEVELAEVPQMETVRRTMLGKALPFYQTFLAQRGDDRSVRRETGRANLRLGDIEEMLGDYEAAEAAYRRALSLLGPLAGTDDGSRRDLAATQHRLGVLLKKSNRLTEAEASLTEARKLRTKLAAAHPENPDDQRDATDSVYQLGTVLARLGRVKEVAAAYTAAVDAERNLAAAHPDRPDYPRKLGRYLNNRGMLLRSTSADPKPAEASFREALELQAPLADKSPTVAGLQWERARTTENLATVLEQSQGIEQAIPVYRDALARLKQLADDFPAVPDYQNERAVVSLNLGMALIKEAEHLVHQKNLEAAAAPLKEAAERLEDAAGVYRRLIQPERFPHRPDYRQRLAQAEDRLALLLHKTGKRKEAEPHFRAAVQALDELVARYPQVPEYQSELGRALRNLATNLFEQEEPAESGRLLAAAVSHQKAALASNSRNPEYRKILLDSYVALGQVLTKLGDHTRAAEVAEALVKNLPDEPLAAYRAAHLLDSSASLAEAAAGLPEPKRKELARTRAELALKQLQRAVKGGAKLGPQSLDAPAFKAIRSHSPGALESLKKTLEAVVVPRIG